MHTTYRPAPQARSLPANRLEAIALYGALALINAIVFGTLSFHPF